MFESDPTFPPLLTGIAIDADAAPFIHACAGARSGALGAGDLVWARDPARARLALVLEPEVARPVALQMLPLMMVAAGDCLGALMPPQVPVLYRWPDRLLLNGGDAGGFQLAVADSADTAPPDWLVVGFEVAITPIDAEREPGERAHVTSITEEGGGDLTTPRIVQSLAAHLMTWLNIWQDDGLRAAHDIYMGRLEGRGAVAGFRHGGHTVKGLALGLDDAAGLIIKPETGRAVTLALAEALGLDGGRGP